MNSVSVLADATKIRLRVRMQFACPNVQIHIQDKQEQRICTNAHIHKYSTPRSDSERLRPGGRGGSSHPLSAPALYKTWAVHDPHGSRPGLPQSPQLLRSCLSAELASPLAALPRSGPAGEALSAFLECAVVLGSLSSSASCRTSLLCRRLTACTAA